MSDPPTFDGPPDLDTDYGGYDPAIHQDDTIDVMVLIEPSGFGIASGAHEPDIVDLFVSRLSNRLQVLGNHPTIVVLQDELPEENDYPNNVFGVVTNVASAARWARSWGGNLVTIERLSSSALRLTGRSDRATFDVSQLEEAAAFTYDEMEALPDDPPDVGLTAVEQRQLEVVLANAERAPDEVRLNAEDRALLEVAVQTMRAQLASPEPDRHIIGRVLRRFTSIGGGVLLGVLGNYMTDLLRHFHVPWP